VCYLANSGQTGRPRKTWIDVADKDRADLHIKLSDAMNLRKWRKVIRENWSDSDGDS